MLLQKSSIILLFLIILSNKSWTQIQDSSKIRIGIKGLYEKSGAPALVPDKQAIFNYGLQMRYRLGTFKSSIESGIISMTRKTGFGIYRYKYLQIPIKYRFDFFIFYFSIGTYADYLLYDSYDHSNNRNRKVKNKINYGYSLSFGIEKNIIKKISFFLEGESTNNLTGQEKYGNYGVAFGFNYGLN